MSTPWYDPVEKKNDLSMFGAGKSFPAGAPPAPPGFTNRPNHTKLIDAAIRANAEYRPVTNAEILDCYDFEAIRPGDASHLRFISAAARQAHKDAQTAKGIPPAQPPEPNPTRILNFAEIVAAVEAKAMELSKAAKPDAQHFVEVVRVNPAKAAALASKLAGTGKEPSDVDVLKCLRPEKVFRAPGPGDYSIPGGLK